MKIPKHLLIAATFTLMTMSAGCASLSSLLSEEGEPTSSGHVLDGFEAEPLTAPEQVAQADGWRLLSAEALRKQGTCEALTATSPVAEYWQVEVCNAGPKGSLGWLRGRPKGFYETFISECNSELIACGFVPKALEGQAIDEHHKLFQGLTLMFDEKLLKAIGAASAHNLYYGGSFFNDRHFGFHEGITGLGIIGSPKDRPYLDNLVNEPWKAENLGRALRNKVSLAYWWMGDREAAPMLMTMLTRENALAHQNREFRMIILGALGAWGSDAAVPFCKESMRDLGSEDRAACMFYLLERGDKSSADDMIRYVEESHESAIYAVGMTQTPAALKYLSAKAKDGYIEEYVALALAGDKGAMSNIERQIVSDSGWRDDRVARSLSYLAGTPHQGKALELVKKIEASMVADSSARKVAEVRTVLAKLGDKSAIPKLIEALNDPDEHVRMSVAEGIGAYWGQTLSPTAVYRIVADQALYEALVKAIAREADDGNRANLTFAALNIRAALRLK